jgi:hypothetical protein
MAGVNVESAFVRHSVFGLFGFFFCIACAIGNLVLGILTIKDGGS